MAKSERSQININLSTRGQKTVGKVFYQWAINAGRTIIVLIELVALGALGYRFYIDRQIVDQHDEIIKKEYFVKAQSDHEKVYRAVQEKLKHIKNTQDDTITKFTVMNEILKAVAAGTFFSTSLSINERSATVEGTTFSILTLTNFVESLKHVPIVSGISINEVHTTDAGVQFKILIEINQPQDAS